MARVLSGLGVDKAYTLDGGQTASMIVNGELINSVEFGYQRAVSDIIFFATAIPERQQWEAEHG
jgi:exopolysaccharide biosynthesis protein